MSNQQQEPGAAATQAEPAEIDVTRPSIARVYDAVLGGKDNFEVDRAIADEALRIVPEIGDVGRYNRAVLRRGVTFLTREAGIRQFIDLGSGLPTVENTHQVAQRQTPGAQVVYVDNDPIVLAHGRALLAENDNTSVVTADLRDPADVLARPEISKHIDLSQPVGVLLIGVIHHLGDDEDPNGIVAAYLDAIPSGSYLFLTHFCASSPDAVALEDAMLRDLGTGRFRTLDEIAGYFSGLELLDPGVVYLPEWRPDEPVSPPLTVGQRLMAGGIGRKP
ncbi:MULTISPECIES: SAM-dependent methyltransferase [unclassified Pseudofrankia]|uniref:SAM-dependent methyltransferase n=1 Tax=unclassified Pseudofrankia TaxID=2994372 RepID=UPI0008D95C3D|nr:MULTISPECIES: SAM-dependent methyltransferase [unclassified Pseudofrankia]MDT3440584.1 SAM-dependent methyltransferase [Pseudofrankia sp. BMG5.37]OHV62149.1 SAM-dependent methyltransferase [Pseudofrankia sp. BMG5.36]